MMLSACLPSLGAALIEQIESYSIVKNFDAGQLVVRQGQIITFLPIVIKGNVKVFSHEDTMQFLLYYISAGDTCIFSFAHLYNEKPIPFSAITTENSALILLPINKVREWHAKYLRFSNLLLQGYQKHYEELLHTTKEIICYNLEGRLLSYLKTKSNIEKSDTLTISHQEIANDLGTSREVITRLMKKLGINKNVIQTGRKIKIL